MLPFWLPQMDKDIRKEAPKRPPSALDLPPASKRRLSAPQNVEVIVDRPASTITTASTSSRPNGQVTERTPLLASVHDDDEEYDDDHQRTQKGIKPAFSWATLFQSATGGQQSGGGGLSNNLLSSVMARDGVGRVPHQQKRIVLPVRVEPKVFFANERTFLSWLHCKDRCQSFAFSTAFE